MSLAKITANRGAVQHHALDFSDRRQQALKQVSEFRLDCRHWTVAHYQLPDAPPPPLLPPPNPPNPPPPPPPPPPNPPKPPPNPPPPPKGPMPLFHPLHGPPPHIRRRRRGRLFEITMMITIMMIHQ